MGPKTSNNCAGEGQQQIATQPDRCQSVVGHLVVSCGLLSMRAVKGTSTVTGHYQAITTLRHSGLGRLGNVL
jgi:hypothetical protein